MYLGPYDKDKDNAEIDGHCAICFRSSWHCFFEYTDRNGN